MEDPLHRTEAVVAQLRDREDMAFALRKLAQAWWDFATDFEKRRLRIPELDQRITRLRAVEDPLIQAVRADLERRNR